MSSIFVGFVIVLVAPLVLAGRITSIIGLSLQGLLMGSLALETGRLPSVAALVLLVDLFLVRGVFVPLALYRASRERRDGALTVSLFTWALAGAAVFLAHRFGTVMAGADEAVATHLFVSAAALLLGLLALGTQTTPFGQVVGVLRVENAIALFELAEPGSPPLPVQLGLLFVYLLTVATFTGMLRRLPEAGAPLATVTEEPTL